MSKVKTSTPEPERIGVIDEHLKTAIQSQFGFRGALKVHFLWKNRLELFRVNWIGSEGWVSRSRFIGVNRTHDGFVIKDLTDT